MTKIFNETDIPIIASDGLFRLESGASITRTYDASKQLADYPGIGRENWVVTGGMSIGALKMGIMGATISTEKCSFPLPYNLALTMLDGSYTIAHRLRILPGSTLTVGRGAELTVSGSLDALDGLKQGSMSDAVYVFDTSAGTAAITYPAGKTLLKNQDLDFLRCAPRAL